VAGCAGLDSPSGGRPQGKERKSLVTDVSFGQSLESRCERHLGKHTRPTPSSRARAGTGCRRRRPPPPTTLHMHTCTGYDGRNARSRGRRDAPNASRRGGVPVLAVQTRPRERACYHPRRQLERARQPCGPSSRAPHRSVFVFGAIAEPCEGPGAWREGSRRLARNPNTQLDCRRYRPAARHAEPIDTSTSHVGFRCVVRGPARL